MKRLTLELVRGAKVEVDSIGWKGPEAGGVRRQFYAVDRTGKALVVTLQPALPRNFFPGFPAVLSREPFPEAVCVEISPCRLLAPPCYESRKELESQFFGHFVMEPWRAVYRQTHQEALFLKPEDDDPLKRVRANWIKAMRGAYLSERSKWQSEIKRRRTAPLAKLNIPSESYRRNLIDAAKEQLAIVESPNPITGVPCKGWLNLSLDDVKRGCEGIRDAWMQEKWSNENEVNLGTMGRERSVYSRWLKAHTGTSANVFDANTRQTRLEISPPSFGEHPDLNPQFLEGCAKVGFRARFGDNAKTVVYLAHCEVREELTAAELDELKRLNSAVPLSSPGDSIDFQHSPNYRQIFWEENGKKVRANLTPLQANAFSALHHAVGFILEREEWQDEIYGEAPPNDFRPDKLFAYRDGAKIWKRFISVSGDRYSLIFRKV